jgi:hypothetical protein
VLTANALLVGDGWDAEMTTAGDQPDAANTAQGLASIKRLRMAPPAAAIRNRRYVIMNEYLCNSA